MWPSTKPVSACTRSRPAGEPRTSRIWSTISLVRDTSSVQSRKNAWPISDSRTARVVRWNSGPPSRSSSCCTRVVTTDFDSRNWRAASAKLCACATRTKASMLRKRSTPQCRLACRHARLQARRKPRLPRHAAPRQDASHDRQTPHSRPARHAALAPQPAARRSRRPRRRLRRRPGAAQPRLAAAAAAAGGAGRRAGVVGLRRQCAAQRARADRDAADAWASTGTRRSTCRPLYSQRRAAHALRLAADHAAQHGAGAGEGRPPRRSACRAGSARPATCCGS